MGAGVVSGGCITRGLVVVPAELEQRPQDFAQLCRIHVCHPGEVQSPCEAQKLQFESISTLEQEVKKPVVDCSFKFFVDV